MSAKNNTRSEWCAIQQMFIVTAFKGSHVYRCTCIYTIGGGGLKSKDKSKNDICQLSAAETAAESAIFVPVFRIEIISRLSVFSIFWLFWSVYLRTQDWAFLQFCFDVDHYSISTMFGELKMWYIINVILACVLLGANCCSGTCPIAPLEPT